MIQDTAWQPVHKWFVLHRLAILNLFKAMQWSMVIATVGSFVLLRMDMQWWLVLEEFARKAGTISALLYFSTLVPGMMKRFNVLPLVRTTWMLFRRQFGVLMFLTAIFHESTMATFPMVIGSGKIDLSLFTKHEVYGLVALCALFPMWLTSNELSVRKLGKWWNWLHRLTYIALCFIYLHVATVSEKLKWLFVTVMVIEVLSWLYYFVQINRKKQINAQSVQ
jgi:DMSO/TMAO reductase YedYZ heme-binding membrane subunit